MTKYHRIFIASYCTEGHILFTIGIIVIMSTIVIVSASVKCTNVVRPHNGMYDLRIFAIFSKTGFLDIAPLCGQPSVSSKKRTSLTSRTSTAGDSTICTSTSSLKWTDLRDFAAHKHYNTTPSPTRCCKSYVTRQTLTESVMYFALCKNFEKFNQKTPKN